MEVLGSSIDFDRRLAFEDVRINRAYARELKAVGVLSGDELDTILSGLDQVEDQLRDEPTLEDEDIHTAVERMLGEAIGDPDVAAKVPTGRSRNDLAVTEMRLYLASAIQARISDLETLQASLLEQARDHQDAILPGYTHLRRGQPVVFAQYLLAYFWALDRDRARLAAARTRTLGLALGAGALAGNPFGVNRQRLAKELGFESVLPNSIDAISSRDYILEFLSASAILGTNLSRMAEDLILWSGAEYGFVAIDESYATGSSLMPQKRNPDSLELIRGKSGRLAGNLVSLMTTVKGIATGYQRDLQEDKEPAFDTLDTLAMVLPVMNGVIKTLAVNRDKMAEALSPDLLATDLAEYLVRKGIPFRNAHGIVGQVLAKAAEKGVPPAELTLEDLHEFSPEFDETVDDVWDYRESVARRDTEGGVSLRAIAEQIEKAEKRL
jgi:argininosuccinate lyase